MIFCSKQHSALKYFVKTEHYMPGIQNCVE